MGVQIDRSRVSSSARSGSPFVEVVPTEIPIRGRQTGHGSHKDTERDAWVELRRLVYCLLNNYFIYLSIMIMIINILRK